MNIGKVSENVLKRSVLKYINNDSSAGHGVDCAIFTGMVANEDADTCGRHAVLRAVNNAASSGRKAVNISTTILMPEHMREIKLKTIAMDIADTVKELGLAVIDGHSETVAGLTLPVVIATVTAVNTGFIPSKPVPGQAIIMTKWMAMSGSAKIAKTNRDKLSTKYPDFIIDDCIYLDQFYSVVPEAAVAVRSGAVCMNDCSDGGIFAALWQLADAGSVGLTVNLRDIPVMQESIEVCEYFDINPYRLRSDGSLLIVCDNPDEMIKALNEAEIKATLIGHITEGSDRVIVSGEERRFLEEPRQDEGVMVQ